MLIKCPECELQVSDKALNCPHCGYPMQPESKQVQTRKSNRRKRLPNGFGQISEIKNQNLRNPFRAMVTVGKTETGRPICKPLKPESYFRTYNDAYAALVEYNKNPYDLEQTMTVAELYDKWTDQYFKMAKSKSTITTTKSAWSYCSSIYNMKVNEVRARHLKGCIEDGMIIVKGQERRASPGIKLRMKSMFNVLFDFALEYELVDRNYARTFALPRDVAKEVENSRVPHVPFTENEMEILWKHIDDIQYADVILIQCYSGWRPQELGLIKLENVDLEKGYFVGGLKSDAGRERVVPIHSKIQNLVERKYKEAVELGSKYLINCTDTNVAKYGLKLTYDKYQKRFTKVVAALELNENHRAHDPRMHFITMAKATNVNDFAIKRIVGHEIKDITEKIYTERPVEWLKEEIEKII